MQITMRKTSELLPYVNNARKNDHAVDAVASSIKNYGFKQPIVIDSQGEIIAGHTRLKAAKKLQLDEVPCIIADDLTPAQVKAYRIADNKVAELSEWDMDLLKLELEDIEGFTGFENLTFDEKNGFYDEKELTTENHGESASEMYDRYMNSTIRQIIITLDQNQYEKVIFSLKEIQNKYDLESNSDAIIKALEELGYEVL